MRIGLTGGAATADKLIEQAQKAEADGFTSLWYASIVQGDPLVSMALAGRATQRIELGTAVLQTYPCHPVLQARRAASVVAAMGRPGFTLGVGPSHEANIRQHYGMSYDRPAKNTEEYLAILGAVLRDEAVDVDGEEWSAHLDAGATPLAHPVPVLVAALAPRMLRAAGALGDGAILWIAPVAAIERMAAVVRESAAEAGRPAPRIVSGLPVVVHDDLDEARAAVAHTATFYEHHANYQRVLKSGGAAGAVDAAIIGNEATVRRGIERVIEAGATDFWANIVPAGNDRSGSMRRTTDLLRELIG